MKLRYLSLGVVAVGITIAGSASQANADIPGSSGCQASGTWAKEGITVVAETTAGVFTIPRSDTVSWQGSVAGEPGVYSGAVSVDLPWPIGEVVIDDWSGESDVTSNSGAHEYDLPSLVPAGVEFEVSGVHSDENGGCSATLTFKVAGGAFDSPFAAVALGGTAVAGAGVIFVLKPLFKKVI